MPRGGRRLGAGAPFGNTNAVTTGNYSRRIREVWLLLHVLSERHDVDNLRKAIGPLIDAGLLRSGRPLDMRRALPIVHPLLVDCFPPVVNQNNQPAAPSINSTPPQTHSPESADSSAPTQIDAKDEKVTKRNDNQSQPPEP